MGEVENKTAEELVKESDSEREDSEKEDKD